jgi:hypothetical protein
MTIKLRLHKFFRNDSKIIVKFRGRNYTINSLANLMYIFLLPTETVIVAHPVSCLHKK